MMLYSYLDFAHTFAGMSQSCCTSCFCDLMRRKQGLFRRSEFGAVIA
jgi:hypothetical protein